MMNTRFAFLMLALVSCAALSACKEDGGGASSAAVEPAVEVAEPVDVEVEVVDTSDAVQSGRGALVDRRGIAPQQQPEYRTFYYQCGADILVRFSVNEEDDRADMSVANVSYAMERAISASGAKYQNLGNPDTYLWNKGNTAMLRIDGEDKPDCVEVAAPAPPAKPYRASGNEPGWNVVVEDGVVALTADYGDVTASLPVTSETQAAGSRTIIAGDGDKLLTLTIIPGHCRDDMSGELFADRVELVYGAKIYRGCGQSMVRDIVWQLETINGVNVPAQSDATLTLASGGLLYGRSGCNRYTGTYSLEGENINIPPHIASTMMACLLDDLMALEQQFLQALPTATYAILDDSDEVLTLTDNGENVLVFRKTDKPL